MYPQTHTHLHTYTDIYYLYKFLNFIYENIENKPLKILFYFL